MLVFKPLLPFISFPSLYENIKTPAELLANVISRSEAMRNLLNDNDLRFLADARNDKILYFARFITV